MESHRVRRDPIIQKRGVSQERLEAEGPVKGAEVKTEMMKMNRKRQVLKMLSSLCDVKVIELRLDRVMDIEMI